MPCYDAPCFTAMFGAIADRLEEEKAHLCALDGLIGDGDHGIAMAQGFSAVRDAVARIDVTSASPADIFNAAAKSFLNAVGASSGPLYATAFMRAAASLKGKPHLSDDDVAGAIQAMARGIEERGKAMVGEKTMVDAWAPAASALAKARSSGKTLAVALQSAHEAAACGAQATKDMIAAKGRASRLGERAVGHMDPGAASATIIIGVIAESLVAAGRGAGLAADPD